jgi:hypothetical protein
MLKFAVDGAKPEQETDTSTTAYKGVDAFSEVTGLLTGTGNILERIFSKVNEKVGFEAILNATRELDQQSANLVKALGVGSTRSNELINVISETIPDIVGMGLDAKTAFDTYNDVIDTFDTNIILSKETIKDFAATSKVTGVSTKELAEGFRSVGASLQSVGDRMTEVAKIANQAGVTVSAVSAGVVKNLDKMNLYNFEGGVKGLAKMAAQSARLGIDMEKIFTKTEDLFDPEKAIDFSASLQRLGVTSSELLDPLRAMDLAQNDPTELQNQIANLGKDFVRFNEQNKQFEILPGAKRRMREVAETLGMSASEFSKMAINAASFDEKLNKIKFSPDVAEEDRELVATMAQFNKGGVAEVKIREMKTNEKGEQEWTGEYITKAVGDLKTDDIKNLKEQQELQGETMEEIAIDQLSEQKKLNSTIDKLITTIQYGLGSSDLVQTGYKSGLKTMRSGVKEITPTVDDVRKSPDAVNDLLKSYGIDLGGILESIQTTFNSVLSSESVQTILKGITDYFGITTPSATASATPSSVASSTVAALSSASVGGGGTTPAAKAEPSNVNITHTFNFSNLPNYVTSTEVENLLKQYVMNPITASAIVTSAGNKNAGLTTT